jgi:MFS family permease
VLSSYRRVFSHPGALAFSLTGMVARLPIAMMTLGIVLLVSAISGSYALAGGVSAAFTVGNALFAVPHGRLADLFGQHRVLYVDSLVFSLSSALMIVSIHDDWALPWPHVLAALAGASMSQVGTMVRARWAALLSDDAERHTAFAVEGVVDEVVFVTGPALVTFLSTLYAPETGLVVAVVCGVVGALALAAQRGTEPGPHPPSAEGTRAPMPWRMLLPLTLGAIALGSLFGAQEVATVATADDAGNRAASGLMLAAFAAGSLLSGVVAGAVHWQRSPLSRARVGMWLLAAGALTIPLLSGLVLVSVALFVTGLALAPTLIAIFSVVEAGTPRSRLNEAMGFLQTGVGGGIAPGAWLAGVVADDVSGIAAFWVSGVSALLAALSGLVARDVPVGRDAVTGGRVAQPPA